jgi:hypothetical protein
MTHPSVFHPGPPAPTQQQRLLMLDDDGWEAFIEDCLQQRKHEGEYLRIQRLGGAGDKGRDICAYQQENPTANSWDLFQAKCYAGPLSPSEFAPELAKFFHHLSINSYAQPKNYYICARQDIGTKLYDILLNTEDANAWLLKHWKSKKNSVLNGFVLNEKIEIHVTNFQFNKIKNFRPADLLEIHSRNATKHWEKFGILPERGPSLDMPPLPTNYEQNYIAELLAAYGEYTHTKVTDLDSIPPAWKRHFRAQRRHFYFAEGLNLFSRDKLPGAFGELLNQVEVGIETAVAYPHTNGITRLEKTIETANVLIIGNNPLKHRLQAGDLAGSCHHLANLARVSWVENDD